MEKKTASYILVQASDFQKSVENLMECMKGTLADYEVASITETPLMDVYPFEADSVKNDRPE